MSIEQTAALYTGGLIAWFCLPMFLKEVYQELKKDNYTLFSMFSLIGLLWFIVIPLALILSIYKIIGKHLDKKWDL